MRYQIGFKLLVLLAFVGCTSKPPQSSTKEANKVTSDSTIIREIIKPVLITIPGDKAVTAAQVECDPVTNKPKPISQASQGKQAGVKVQIDDQGKLTAEAECAAMQVLLEYKEREITRISKVLDELKEVKTPEPIIKIKYRTYWFDIPARIIAILVLLFLAFKLFLKRN